MSHTGTEVCHLTVTKAKVFGLTPQSDTPQSLQSSWGLAGTSELLRKQEAFLCFLKKCLVLLIMSLRYPEMGEWVFTKLKHVAVKGTERKGKELNKLNSYYICATHSST